MEGTISFQQSQEVNSEKFFKTSQPLSAWNSDLFINKSHREVDKFSIGHREEADDLNSWPTKLNFSNCLCNVTWKIWEFKHNPWETANVSCMATGSPAEEGRGDGFTMTL